MVKIPDSTYAKADLKQVANNENQMNDDKRTLLLSLLEEFKDLFDGTLGDWATDTVDLEINPYSKRFNSRYYLVPGINKNFFERSLNA